MRSAAILLLAVFSCSQTHRTPVPTSQQPLVSTPTEAANSSTLRDRPDPQIPPAATTKEPDQTAGLMTREQFRNLVLDLTPDQVGRELGPPEPTVTYGNEPVRWVYKRKTHYRGYPDAWAILEFKDGHVEKVMFRN